MKVDTLLVLFPKYLQVRVQTKRAFNCSSSRFTRPARIPSSASGLFSLRLHFRSLPPIFSDLLLSSLEEWPLDTH